MQYGYFDDEKREYVITRPDTPRPWSNYLGSLDYGAIITNNAGGYSFYKSALSSRFLKLRPNSVPLDQPGRYFYLRDQDSGDYWSSSWQPVGKSLDSYESVCRHGTAYTIITSTYSDITSESTYFVPLGASFEYWKLSLKNNSTKKRNLKIYTYCEFASCWHMPNDLSNLQYNQFIAKAIMSEEMLHIASHPYKKWDGKNLMGCDRTWMCVNGATLAGYETVRERFLGSVYNTYANPAKVADGNTSNFLAEGENPVGVLAFEMELEAGQEKTVVVQLGLGSPESHGFSARKEYGSVTRCNEELEKLKSYWHNKLAGFTANTPNAEFNSMINVWGAYNALIAYTWSRHASLIYNGERDGLGFRDTVQDFLGALPHLKNEIQDRLELMLSGQLSTGGAIPVIKPFDHHPGSMPLLSEEEYRSDDCLWFFNAIPEFVAESGNLDFYNKVIPFADRGEATVFGHLRRAIEFNLERSGANGLPCGLAADWNDCVKMGHNGESIMVSFQLRLALDTYAKIARRLGKSNEAAWADAEKKKLDKNIDTAAWDGKWYLWAIGDDGHRYGSEKETEGKIYINTQVWSVLSGAAPPDKAESAMEYLNKMLATPYGITLSAPPFTNTPPSVMGGVIYNHGIKENAGIFCHTQGWAVIAECLLGNGDRAWEYYNAYMPSAYNMRAEIRESEPYVHCQTTYSTANRNAGKSRVPWLSGTASWSHHSAIQYILGIRPVMGETEKEDGLLIDPCIPRAWTGFTATKTFHNKTINIEIKNPHSLCKGVKALEIDGKKIEGNLIPLSLIKDKLNVLAVLEE